MDRLTDRMLKDMLLIIQEDYEAALKEAVEDAREYTRQLLMMDIEETLADFNNTLAEVIKFFSLDIVAYLNKFENITISKYKAMARDLVYVNDNIDIARRAMKYLDGPLTYLMDHLKSVSKLPKLLHDERGGKAQRFLSFLMVCQ